MVRLLQICSRTPRVWPAASLRPRACFTRASRRYSTIADVLVFSSTLTAGRCAVGIGGRTRIEAGRRRVRMRVRVGRLAMLLDADRDVGGGGSRAVAGHVGGGTRLSRNRLQALAFHHIDPGVEIDRPRSVEHAVGTGLGCADRLAIL